MELTWQKSRNDCTTMTGRRGRRRWRQKCQVIAISKFDRRRRVRLVDQVVLQQRLGHRIGWIRVLLWLVDYGLRGLVAVALICRGVLWQGVVRGAELIIWSLVLLILCWEMRVSIVGRIWLRILCLISRIAIGSEISVVDSLGRIRRLSEVELGMTRKRSSSLVRWKKCRRTEKSAAESVVSISYLIQQSKK